MQATGSNPAATLNDEIAASNALADVLRREQAALIAAEIDSLPALTTEKAQLVARIAVLANARYQALAAAGFPDEEAGMKSWVGSSACPAAAAASWNALLDAACSAKELNRVNGLLIAKHLGRNQASINVLQQGTRQGPTLYGPNGQTSTAGGSRGLVIG
jgi:flagella synthesis protein FlgN